MKTVLPQNAPIVRLTLVAPGLPLPKEKRSIPLYLATKTAKLIDPKKYPINNAQK